MQLPAIRGTIDRRVLVNFRVDPNVAAQLLPKPFEPMLVHGHAIVGVCLIRLKHVRPPFVPRALGISSENAAHRFAVRWTKDGESRTGVFIPRRDTDSRLNSLVGGRLFPGEHHHARFAVRESDANYSIAMHSDDGSTHVSVAGTVATSLPHGSVFRSVAEASDFFESGALGYSATRDPTRFDGLELRCRSWCATPLDVQHVESSYFNDPQAFPAGSASFDCALLMRDIAHEWIGREDVRCQPNAGPNQSLLGTVCRW